MSDSTNSVFDRQYLSAGMNAQRHYPNESLLQFFGGRLFSIARARRPEVRILELGCGSGANLWMVAREEFSAQGIDISAPGLEICRQKLAQWDVEAELFQADMQTLPFPDASFDVIFDVVSMQHLDVLGHMAAYKEVARCLKPNGLFFQYHLGADSYSFTHGGGRLIDEATVDDIKSMDAPLRGNGPTCFLTRSRINELLEEAGLAVKELETVMRTHRGRAIHTQYLSVVCVPAALPTHAIKE